MSDTSTDVFASSSSSGSMTTLRSGNLKGGATSSNSLILTAGFKDLLLVVGKMVPTNNSMYYPLTSQHPKFMSRLRKTINYAKFVNGHLYTILVGRKYLYYISTILV